MICIYFGAWNNSLFGSSVADCVVNNDRLIYRAKHTRKGFHFFIQQGVYFGNHFDLFDLDMFCTV